METVKLPSTDSSPGVVVAPQNITAVRVVDPANGWSGYPPRVEILPVMSTQWVHIWAASWGDVYPERVDSPEDLPPEERQLLLEQRQLERLQHAEAMCSLVERAMQDSER